MPVFDARGDQISTRRSYMAVRGIIIKCKLHNYLVHTICFSSKYICIKYHNHTTHFDTILSSSGLQANLLSRQCTNCIHEESYLTQHIFALSKVELLAVRRLTCWFCWTKDKSRCSFFDLSFSDWSFTKRFFPPTNVVRLT